MYPHRACVNDLETLSVKTNYDDKKFICHNVGLYNSLISLQFYCDQSFLNDFENDFQDLQTVQF